jgi:hypothetical protein
MLYIDDCPAARKPRVEPHFDKINFRTPRPLGVKQRDFLKANCDSVNHDYGRALYGEYKHHKWYVTVVAPNQHALKFLADRTDWIPNWVEPALNILVSSTGEAERLNSLFDRCFVHNWHGDQQTKRYLATTYTAERKARRKYGWYADKPSKISGGLCFHVEGRHRGMDAVRKIGINSNEDFLTFDFRAYWQQNLNLFEVDDELLGRWWRNKQTGGRRRLPEIRISAWGEEFNVNVDARTGVGMRLHARRERAGKQRRHSPYDEYDIRLSPAQTCIDAYGRGPYLRRLDVSNLLPQPAQTSSFGIYARIPHSLPTALIPRQNPKIDLCNTSSPALSHNPVQDKVESCFPNKPIAPPYLASDSYAGRRPIPASDFQPKPSPSAVSFKPKTSSRIKLTKRPSLSLP